MRHRLSRVSVSFSRSESGYPIGRPLDQPGGGCLRRPAAPFRGMTRTVEDAAVKLGMSVQVIEVRGRDEFEAAFAAIARGRADALVVDSDPVFFTARTQLVALATSHRLPAVYQAREFVVIGGLMSYGFTMTGLFEAAAVYGDRILKGAKASDLPIEQPTRFEMVINLRTAKALRLKVPESLLVRADEVLR